MKTASHTEKAHQKIVVIGTSAGGRSALIKLIQQLPENFPAPLLIVQHIAADSLGSSLIEILNKDSKIKCAYAEKGKIAKPGHAYLAPADFHLMIDSDFRLQVTRGAHENRARPAIDPLFRSAAINYGTRTIAILLTGYLDDGTSGLTAVQRCGGTCIIQDPKDAAYPEMPLNALNQLKPDYCIPIAQMGAIVSEVVGAKPKKQKKAPNDIAKEALIAQRVTSDLQSVEALGDQVPFNCPGCGGVLWKITDGDTLRYRCHTGHAYTAITLLAEQNKKLEETMWTALRMFEERRNLLTTMSNEQKGPLATITKERADLSQIHIDRIRAILLADDQKPDSNLPV
jgi:two-component system chemotaxis response regulator CheB